MGKKLLFLFALIILPALAYSQGDTQEKHPIDVWYENCIDSNGSTMGMIMCADSAAVLWDIELNKNYKLLMDVLVDKAKEDLREAQREWITFRDKEMQAISSYYEYVYEIMGGGTMYPMLASGARMEVIRKRALELKGMYDELSWYKGEDDER